MATAMMAAIVLLAGAAQPSTQDGVMVLTDVLVTASGDPGNLPEAGVHAPYIALEVTDPQGASEVLYLLRMIRQDPYPPLGSRCTFEVVRQPLLPGRLVDSFRDTPPPENGEWVLVAEHFDCRITSDSPVID